MTPSDTPPSRSIADRIAPLKTPEGIDEEIRIEVSHAGGTDYYDPNRMVGACLYPAALKALTPLDVKSDISGAPALRYATCEITLYLTAEELVDFSLHRLTPDAYHALRKKHGDFFEIGLEYYDPQTGEAFQPFG